MKVLVWGLFLLAFATSARAAETKSQYLIRFKSEVNHMQAQRVLEERGFLIERVIAELGIYVAYPAPGVNERDAVKKVEKNKSTLYIEKNERKWSANVNSSRMAPNDPQYSSQYALRQVSAESAWNYTVGSYDVVVAVSDTGVAYNHSDLRAQMWTNTRETPGNGVDDDGNGHIDDVRGWDFVGKDNDPADEQGHGTHVAGIIGAEGNNSVGISGINWRVTIMPVRFLDASGRGDTLAGVETILYAAKNGAHIINASWGSTSGSSALFDAIKFAHDKGVLFVAAAGNSTTDNDSRAHYPSSYDVPNVIAVAATEQGSGLAYFSNFGAADVDLGAPGSGINATYPPDTYRSLSGTSMASPLVAGIAALIVSQNSSLSVVALRNAVFNAVVARSSLAGKTATGGEANAALAIEQLDQGFQLWPAKITVKRNLTLQLTAYRANGAVTWSSSDNSIATVDANGVVKGLKVGSVQITARDANGQTRTSAVQVVQASGRRGD